MKFVLLSPTPCCRRTFTLAFMKRFAHGHGLDPFNSCQCTWTIDLWEQSPIKIEVPTSKTINKTLRRDRYILLHTVKPRFTHATPCFCPVTPCYTPFTQIGWTCQVHLVKFPILISRTFLVGVGTPRWWWCCWWTLRPCKGYSQI